MDYSRTVKYLGIILDEKLSFKQHIQLLSAKLSRLRGLCYILRKKLPVYQLIKFYLIYIKPVIQYGILIYGCTSRAALDPLYKIQCNILRTIHYKKKYESVSNLFCKEILTVYELHIYDLFKFNVHSLRDDSKHFLKPLLENIPAHGYDTRSKNKKLLTSSTQNSFQLYRRALYLHNLLVKANPMYNIEEMTAIISESALNSFFHKFSDLFIFGNNELTNEIFKLK